MILGIVAGYGLGLLQFFQYLVPLQSRKVFRELFVGTVDTIPVGSSLKTADLKGQTINLVRLSNGDPDHPESGFKALSSTCPHLGCKVHWEPANNRFFCPCHHGVFDKEGIAIEGPPAKEKKNLPEYQVKVDSRNGWVYILVEENNRYGV